MIPEEEKKFILMYEDFRCSQLKIEGYMTCADRTQIKEWEKFRREIEDDYRRGWNDCVKYYSIVKIK